ncbi:hypothetical protein BI364_07260 [Acidihalobacter yilgarnensis]|uniref:Glycine zipper 2TM domain-containing protein n=1 Tax=Acidihalobacter yilgarnensis TaxID=2819280 RepID=A0A1D8IMT5_9GAMM|nr:hypothetical protein [Acidihalobacter yilgarnensis]AOU97788.1 hypothetical protein BI364_07260 [Acidihalobacter yilgarnensis]
MKKYLLFLALPALISLGGCASYGYQSYGTGLRAMQTETGVVVHDAMVRINPGTQSIGTMAGAGIGGIAAAGAAQGSGQFGQLLAGAVGALVGGTVGNAVQQQATGPAQQVTVELPDRQLITVVEQGSMLHLGERVGISYSPSGRARVFPM